MSITSQLNLILNLLINQYFTYKFFHWNFEGEDFYSYHQLFDSNASTVLASQDDIAERMRELQSKVQIESEINLLNSLNTNQKNLTEILTLIISQHTVVIDAMHEVIKLANFSEDFGTADIITGFVEQQQKMLWFIQSSSK
jgi:starvation-inducible DNA-binding protein